MAREQICMNVTSAVNPKGIRKDVRNGRDVLIVSSVTMPADIVMNGIKYPKEAIEASFATLERAPAPVGHPKFNGAFVSARDPEAMNHFHVGAWNENVKWDGSRILLDKVIDVQVAGASEAGKRLLNAIEKGDPISTSTGILAEVETENGNGYTKVVKSLLFDHDAILLDEEPAATTDQGVGMLVNGKQIPVMNYNLDSTLREIDWAGQEMVRSIQRAADATLWAKVRDKVLGVIKEAVGITDEPATVNSEETDMSAEDIKKLNEEMTGLKALVNEASTAAAGAAPAADLASVMAAIKALTEKVDGLMTAKEADDASALEADTQEVVDAGLMNAEEAKAADPLVVNALAKKARDMKAKPLAAPLLRANSLQQDRGQAPKVEDHFV